LQAAVNEETLDDELAAVTLLVALENVFFWIAKRTLFEACLAALAGKWAISCTSWETLFGMTCSRTASGINFSMGNSPSRPASPR
jgi:hypothetical protein